ncbi:MAG: hypothetical protein U1F58_01425 [Burkholderiales bacterium]
MDDNRMRRAMANVGPDRSADRPGGIDERPEARTQPEPLLRPDPRDALLADTKRIKRKRLPQRSVPTAECP